MGLRGPMPKPKKKCIVDGCPNEARTRGCCPKHYQNLRKYGDPLASKPDTLRKEQEKWINDLVSNPPSDCVVWPYRISDNGYGMMSHRPATHFVLEAAGQPRPTPNHYAMHSCDNPPCVNPTHLSWGTPTENVQDALQKKRNPTYKLTADDVREMVRLRTEEGWGSKRLAKRFGVSTSTVKGILSGKYWRHLGLF